MPNFLIYCHRFFEIRFLIVSGILEHLCERGKVTFMMPEDMAQSFRSHISQDVDIEIADYKKNKGKLKNTILAICGDILYLTFPNTHKLPNATAKFHRDHYNASRWITRKLVVGSSLLASKSRIYRGIMLWLYYRSLPKHNHKEIIERIDPDLMIGCSFGMSSDDAAFLAEARVNGIESAVIVQSWDRTSNKGYPTVHPDHALVWNEIMKQECVTHLEFDEDAVHVTGAPLWDTHFHKLKQPKDPNWRKDLGIKEDTKVLFFSCGGFGSHPANMEIIPKVFDFARRQPFNQRLHVIFRMYPQYLTPVTRDGDGKKKKDEIEALLEQYKGKPNITIQYPQVELKGRNFMPTEGDHKYMTECLRQCDISLSQVSSQMIEACIFGKPAINVEFGRRITDKYDLKISDYKTEHLQRIYRTGAIYRVLNPEQLEETIASALDNPNKKEKEREALVQQEAPCYRGNASQETAKILTEIAMKTVRTK